MCSKCNNSSRKNFFVNVDRDGKCPVMSDKPVKPYYTQYVNDKPVLVVPHLGQKMVWDYSTSQFLALQTGLALPMFQGRVITF